MDEDKKEEVTGEVKEEVTGEVKDVKQEEVKEIKKEEKTGLSIASMVLGIVSIVLICFIWISIPCAILAVIFGFIGRKKGGKGMATAGLVLGIITLVFCILGIIGAFNLGSYMENMV
ncbi:MAG: DUF4190 domain-containing protein [Oscillospiraceae bacterium]|nr:DUF4190 domain-containing protein [Oscillospiraceae bacterium]